MKGWVDIWMNGWASCGWISRVGERMGVDKRLGTGYMDGGWVDDRKTDEMRGWCWSVWFNTSQKAP